jgi:outer membrane immunogenic protein
MRSGFAGVALSVAALSAGGARAADLPSQSAPPVSAPAPAPVSNWGGLYAGSFVGGALGSFSTRQSASASGAAWGATIGALAGYDWQNGVLVYGLEGDIGSNYLTRKFAGAPGLVADEVESVYAIHARVRLGYDAGEFMPFVAGGAAYDRSAQFQQAPLDFDGQTALRAGWTLGAGVDAKVVLPIIGRSVVRAEYLYESLPATSYNLNGPTLRTDAAIQYARVALISTNGEESHSSPEVSAAAWGGSYFGAIGGGDLQQIMTQGLGASPAFRAAGPIGGAYSGQNWMFGNAMLGVDGAAMLANVVGRGPQPGAVSTNYQNFLESDLRGRVGYAFGRFLPFVASGLDFGASQQVDNANGNTRTNQPVLAGTLGAGLDYMASERIAIRAEYLYSRSLASESTHLDSDICCSQTRTGNGVRVGAAYFFH